MNSFLPNQGNNSLANNINTTLELRKSIVSPLCFGTGEWEQIGYGKDLILQVLGVRMISKVYFAQD